MLEPTTTRTLDNGNRDRAYMFSMIGPWSDDLLANAGGSVSRAAYYDPISSVFAALNLNPGALPNLRYEQQAMQTFDTEAKAPYPFDRTYFGNNDDLFLYRSLREQDPTAPDVPNADRSATAAAPPAPGAIDRMVSIGKALSMLIPGAQWGLPTEEKVNTAGKYILMALIGLLVLGFGLYLLAGPGRVNAAFSGAVKAGAKAAA